MAEERTIDDDIDRDKKYRIIRGEDGEEELVINEVEEPEELSFQSGIDFIEDEESGVLTAEQYEAARILREEEEARRKQELADLREKVNTYMENDKFSDALECVEYSDENDMNDGEFTCIKLEALTQKFTDFTERKDILKAADEVSEQASPAQRARLYDAYNIPLEKLFSENEAKLNDVNEKYAAEQQSRREILAPRRKKALKNLIIVLSVFAVFLVAAIVCSTRMFSTQSPVLVYITIALGAAAFIALVALVFVARAFAGAARMYAANEKDKSTKLGRERRELVLYGETINAIMAAIAPVKASEEAAAETAEENDIS